MFRDRLVLHQREQAILQRSVDAAKGAGLLASRKLKVALDTTPIFGKGAVKVPRGGRPGYFAKGDFKIDLEHDCVTCPAGQMTRKWKLKKARRGVRGECVVVKQFEFAAEQCRGCVHYRQCVSSKLGKGRSVVLHPEEGLLQEARACRLIGEVKRRQHLVFNAPTRGCVP